MSGFSALDWVLIAILGLSVLFSILKGFTRELISLGALIWGFMLACWFYAPVRERMLPWIKTQEVGFCVAFLLILGLTVLAGAIVSHFAGKLVKKSGLRWADRLLGASFGLVRGVLTCAIIVLVLTVFPLGSQPLNNSRMAPFVIQGARVIVSVAPEDLRSRFRTGFEQVRRAWEGGEQGLERGKDAGQPGHEALPRAQ